MPLMGKGIQTTISEYWRDRQCPMRLYKINDCVALYGTIAVLQIQCDADPRVGLESIYLQLQQRTYCARCMYSKRQNEMHNSVAVAYIKTPYLSETRLVTGCLSRCNFHILIARNSSTSELPSLFHTSTPGPRRSGFRFATGWQQIVYSRFLDFEYIALCGVYVVTAKTEMSGTEKKQNFPCRKRWWNHILFSWILFFRNRP